MCERVASSRIAITIAGFDPSSGAGVTADLKTFSAHEIYGVACITALTVQSTQGVRAVEPLAAGLVQRTLTCLVNDVTLAGIKIGMLGSFAVAREVAAFLAATGVPRDRIVLDPVLRSSSGTALIEDQGVQVIREQLLAQVGWVTPNLGELGILVGAGPVPAAAARLQALAAEHGNDALNVVATGGDLNRPTDFVLTAAGQQEWLEGEKIATGATHGTGCAFSSALLCALMDGQSAFQAARSAKQYVTEALRSAYPIGKGKGPMNHLFPLRRSQ